MNIKKTVLFLVFSLFMLFNTVCFAEITENDLAIGNIYCKQPLEDVIKFYGNPTKTVSKSANGTSFVFNVDDSEIIIYPARGIITGLTIEGNSKLLTPRGIGLGSSIDDVLAVYGTTDYSEKILETEKRELYQFTYFTPKKIDPADSFEMTDPPKSWYELSFFVDGFGKVERIFIMERYELKNTIPIP